MTWVSFMLKKDVVKIQTWQKYLETTDALWGKEKEKNNQVSFAVEGIFRLTFAVWEKTEEEALGSEVATTFDGFSRRFVHFSCYVNFIFHKLKQQTHLSVKVFPFIEFLVPFDAFYTSLC